ncbi:MAG: hypothetical protein J6127_01900 [Clostridiales bacterium]|nr:hypothetical protein [Clostridiales bacterium]
MSGSDKKTSTFAIVSIVIMVISIIIASVYTFSKSPYYVESYLSSYPNSMIELTPGTVATQKLKLDSPELCGIDLLFRSEDRVKDGTVELSITDDEGNHIYDWSVPAYNIVDRSFYMFKTDEPLYLEDYATGNYYLNVSQQCEPGKHNEVSVYICNNADNTYTVTYSCLYAKESSSQRQTLSTLALLTIGLGIFVCYQCRKTYGQGKLTNDSLRLFYIAGIVFAGLYTFMWFHEDGYYISEWAYTFLESARRGELNDYMHSLILLYNGSEHVSSYGIICTIFNSLVILPLYAVERMTGISISIYVYDMCRGISLFAASIITARFIKKTVFKISSDKKTGAIAEILFLVSPGLLLGNLAMGQLDIFAVMFCTLAAHQFVSKKYISASLFLAFATEFKEFSTLFVTLPVICLLIGYIKPKDWPKLILPYLGLKGLGIVLAKLLVTDYKIISNGAELLWDHFGRMFEESPFDMSFFFLILFIVMYWGLNKSIHKTVELRDFFNAVTVVTLAYFFLVLPNPQWVVFISAIFSGMLLLYKDKRDFMLINVVFSIAFVLFTVSWVEHYEWNFQLMLDTKNVALLPRFIDSHLPVYSDYVKPAFRTLMSAALAVSLWRMFFPVKGEPATDRDNDTAVTAGIGITLFVNAALLTGAYVICCGLLY